MAKKHNCEAPSEQMAKTIMDNFDEKNLESLAKFDIPSKAFRMLEGSFGTMDVKPTSYESKKKTAEYLVR